MSNLPAGDVTTQLRIWLNANRTGARSSVNSEIVGPLHTATLNSTCMDLSTLLKLFIGR
jgi:hypothetical protein